ncbi:hypothetical protein QQ045_019997 [Rhodiola kirilowii]
MVPPLALFRKEMKSCSEKLHAILENYLVVHIPVEVGTAPSMKQVEKFASLIADSHRKRIYLQSKEGVWRTSAMVSRWRQYMTRSASQIVTKPAIPPDKLPNDTPLKHDIHLDHDIHGPSQSTETFIRGLHLGEVRHDENGSMKTFSATVNPLKAQSPPGNVFSRYEMSRFLRNKRISPSYLNDRKTRIEKDVTKQNDRIWMPRKENNGYDSVSRPQQSKRLSESVEFGILSSTLQEATTEISRQSGAT